MAAFGTFAGYESIIDNVPDVGQFDPAPSHGSPSTPGNSPTVTRAGIDFLGLGKLFDKILGGTTPVNPDDPTPPPRHPVQVRDIFKMSQVNTGFDFSTHPSIRMTVAYLQKTLDFRWKNGPMRTLVFPDYKPDLAPSELTADGLDKDKFAAGAAALLVKAFYNNVRDRQGTIDIDKANTGVSDFNSHISNQAASLMIQFYRTFFGITEPSEDLASRYRKLLVSAAYRNLKQGQAGQGTWRDADLEMFCHFAKLAACGASENTIREVYNELTTTAPELNGSTFGSIHPDTWRQYRGWLSSGFLDWGDLGATHLDDYHLLVIHGVGRFPMSHTISYYLVDEFAKDKGYYKPPQSSSCFSGSTKIVMAGPAGELKKICNVEPGDVVLSPDATNSEGPPGRRRVAFVSAPRRGTRPLYSLHDYPGVQFTATHPILLPSSSTGGMSLQFVDKDRASSLNPTWQSLSKENISSDLLQSHQAGSEDEVVYDLVFEPTAPSESQNNNNNLPLATYVVEADNGRRLTVASEAPALEWFGPELMFISSAVRQILERTSDIDAVVDLLGTNRVYTRLVLGEAAEKTTLSDNIGGDSDESTAGEWLLQACAKSQAVQDLVEKMIQYLGRTLSHEVRTGWARSLPVGEFSISSNTGAESQQVLFINVVRLLDSDDACLSHPPAIGSRHQLKVWRNDVLVFDDLVSGDVQGQSTLQLYCPIKVGEKEGKLSDDYQNITIQLEDGTSGSVWRGGGPVRKGLHTIIGLGSLSPGTFESAQHAVAEVELRSGVTVAAAPARGEGQPEEGGPELMSLASSTYKAVWEENTMGAYAGCLGARFGDAIAELTRFHCGEDEKTS
ncbi:hypothetical protein QBC41DRAFT_53269 [Cercophora samala]|uniref:Uncharacterized protein n=1 Tax=Cercophora samala TaxID=330535 RepID=A0AA40DGK0_9PEZI|nr:hypothetical protein QBC41DRAFT_53269 [Cercophora samala]